MGTLIGEVRYALRQFWLARVFTVTAVLTLALGIGGTTAIFTLIHAVMLRSLPVGDPVAPVPDRRRRLLLRPGRAAGSLGDVLVSAVRAAEGRAAGVRGAHRISGWWRAPQRAASGRGHDVAGRCAPSSSPATTSRRSASARSAAACSTPADDMPAARAGCRDEPSRLAGDLRRRSVGRRRHARRRGPPVHRRRRHAAGILRRDAARRSAGPVDSRCSRSR